MNDDDGDRGLDGGVFGEMCLQMAGVHEVVVGSSDWKWPLDLRREGTRSVHLFEYKTDC